MGEKNLVEKGVSMAVDLGGVRMQNPVNTASGTFAFGSVFEDFFDVSRLGAITLKGCSAEPWSGNPAPRMCEVPSGMMNTVGLANPGVAGMVEQYGEYLAGLEGRGCRVIVQAAGHSVEEYVAAVELIEELCPWASGVEMNISCPNIARGGVLVGGTPESAAEVVRAVRPRVHRPLLVKMAPVRVPEIARACEAEGADALSLINTINGMSIDVRTRKSRLSKPTGGVSGPAIHAIAVRMVWEAAQAVKIPINGMGGIATWRDAAEMILAGATSVTVGTANFYDPTCAADIVDGLASWAAEQGVTDINELIGAFEC
ncbi:dihydroorotate dehydrogenase [Thermophilibacter sp. ZX-H3]|uniref:dihydroorotate dehydrogenase n=1 Tax=unclassified Thermophilibacter TaxID=2847308 RepID=UPI0040407354